MLNCILILAGLATRLKPITADIPKSLIKINQKSFIDYQLELIATITSRTLLCIGNLGDQIKEYVGNGDRYSSNIKYSEEKNLLGTGGAIVKALPLLIRFFRTLWRPYLDFDYQKMSKFYFKQKTLAVMAFIKFK